MGTYKPRYFFSATQSVDDRLGVTFNFIWASYAGFKELWQQVRAYRKEFPELSIHDVEKKFLSNLHLPANIDLRKACVETDWHEHEKEFSKWILFEACTLYEGWAEKICSDIFPEDIAASSAKSLQFPAKLVKGKMKGYVVTISRANQHTSSLMKNEFFPGLKSSKMNKWAHINEYLVVFRFFKECRNAHIHSDGLVSQDIIDCRLELEGIQAKNSRLFKHAFGIPIQPIGAKIDINIMDCIGFATIVRHLICTFDAAMCVAKSSEIVLEKRLTSLVSKNQPKWVSLPKDNGKMVQRIHRMLAASKIPEPKNMVNVMKWMQVKGLIQ